MRLLTAHQMRDLDARTITAFGIPGQVLMENAARGAVNCFISHFRPAKHERICICCGPGNNGGDGFVMARYFANAGFDTTVLLFSASRDRLTGDAALNRSRLTDLPLTVHDIDPSDMSTAFPYLTAASYIIDALFGTGLNTDVRGGFRDLINEINQVPAPVFALDIPSGLHADTGLPCGICVNAQATATFGGIKPGLVQHPGVRYTGCLYTVDIGIPSHYLAETLPATWLCTPGHVRDRIPHRPADAHKGTSGHLLIIGGAPGTSGAARLAARGALRAGAGRVTLSMTGTAPPPMDEVMILHLNGETGAPLSPHHMAPLLAAAKEKNAIALGPGLGRADETRQAVHAIIKDAPCPLVLDADAINCLEDAVHLLDRARMPLILTPHPKEFSRLTGLNTADIQANRLETARAFARKHRVILILKGAGSIIALPDGTAHINTTGNPGMAAAGMGDVLTGIIGGLLVQGCTPETAAVAGVFLHGLSGDLAARTSGPAGYLASEAADALPGALKLLSIHPDSAEDTLLTRRMPAIPLSMDLA